MQVPHLEHVSKVAAKVSALVILAVMLVIHPDVTWLLGGVSVVTLLAGWGLASRAPLLVPLWLALATLGPTALRLTAGREGPVLDLVWMAGFAGALARTTSWSRWTLTAPWNLLIGGWTLTLSLAWPALLAREAGFRVAGLFDGGAINSWSLLSAPQAAMWILYVVLTQLLGALWFEWVSQSRERARNSMQVWHPLWISVTAASIVAIVQGTVDLSLFSTEFWASLRRATGTLLDANSYGMCAALAAPIGFLGMRALQPRASAAAVAVFAVNIAGMWLSGSRTALLCGVIGTTALVVGLWREWGATTKSPTHVARWVPAGLLAVFVIIMLTPATSPIERALDIPPGRAGLKEILWNRGGYGPIALRMAREYPLTGVGIGGYRTLAPDYWRAMANDALPLDNAQNWWRHQIAELGVFGGALIIAFSLLVAWRVLTARDGDSDLAATSTTRGLLVGLGVTSLFGMPTQNPVVLCWFFALVAWFAALVPDTSRRHAAPRELRLAWLVAAVLAVAYAGGHLLLGHGALHPVQRAERAHRDYVVGAYPPEPLPGTSQFRWTSQESRFFWAVKTPYMAVRFWASHPDIISKPVHVTVTSPCGVLFDEDLASDRSMSLGMALPEGQRTLEATVRVSRTWTPADAGADDQRRLGVGIVADYSSDPAFATNQLRAVKLTGCRAGI